MFELKPSKLTGCDELQPKAFDDARGRFVKVFHEQAFAALGSASDYEFRGREDRSVLRCEFLEQKI